MSLLHHIPLFSSKEVEIFIEKAKKLKDENFHLEVKIRVLEQKIAELQGAEALRAYWQQLSVRCMRKS